VTNATAPLRIVALGGSTKPMAASERALRIAAQAAEDAGAEVTFVTGRELLVPIYDTETADRTPQTIAIVDALRSADGVIIASPGYHGSFSGMVKNALDYAEDLRHEDRPYLEDRAVGLIAVAHGWQTAVGTLNQLREVVHALRGWPAPLEVAVNDSAGLIGDDAADTDPAVVRQLRTMGQQVVTFAAAMRATAADRPGQG
jgi:FMN reductase